MAERKTLLITNDPQTPQTVLILRAERRREFRLNPPRALFGIVPMGTEKVLLVRVTPGAKDKQLRIEKAKTSSPFVRVEEVKGAFNRKKTNDHLLKIQLLPSAPAGYLRAVVKIPCAGASRATRCRSASPSSRGCLSPRRARS